MSTVEWTVLEKLLLTQAVYKYGEDNWFQIARNLKHHALLDRPSDYFNQKNCSLQYYLMVEDIDKQKRQSLTQDMPVVVQLARELYTLRLEELQKAIVEDEEKFLILVSEIDEIRAGKWDNQLLGLDESSALSTSATNTPSAAATTAAEIETSALNTPLDESELSTSMNPSTATEDVPTTTTVSASEDTSEEQAQQSEELLTKEELEENAEKDRVQEEQEKMEADNEENETRGVKESDVTPINEESSFETAANGEEKTSKEIEQQQEVKAEMDSNKEQEQEKEYPVSNKRHLDDTDALEEPELKRQRMENTLSAIPESISSSSGNIESSQEKEQEEEEQEPMSIDTTATLAAPTTRATAAEAYSTDVSQAATPADTTTDAYHLRDGTESVAETESNAATPTSTTTTATTTIKRTTALNKADDQRHKSWLKNINLLWREIANHKNGAMFMNPIKETIAPHYYDIVKRPMDMKTIKNRIRDGLINTTIEFERDVILMLNNSLMYNKEGTEIYQMAREMLDNAQEQIKIFKTADTDTSASSHTRAASMAAKEQRRKSVVNE